MQLDPRTMKQESTYKLLIAYYAIFAPRDSQRDIGS